MILGFFSVESSAKLFTIDPDETLSFAQLIASRGYRLQTYKTTTEDGYILGVHRVVPESYNSTSYSTGRKPVILFHGVMAQSSVFFLNSPSINDTLGFRLIATGRYDVWLPNARGNGLSNEHLRWSSSNPLFWCFTYEQIGLYDIPATLGLIRRHTGHQSVGYIGWSQGGQAFFPLLSLRPEYTPFFQPFIGLASSNTMIHSHSLGLAMSQVFRPLLGLLPGQLMLTPKILNTLGQAFCRPNLPAIICKWAGMELMSGHSTSTNLTRLPLYLRHLPTPIGIWQLAHTMQNAATGRYARFRYPFAYQNAAAYGSSHRWSPPPEYPLERIPANGTVFYFIYGATDAFNVPVDVQFFIEKLQRLGLKAEGMLVQKKAWSHLDMLLGEDAGRLVYAKVVEVLDKYVIQDGPK